MIVRYNEGRMQVSEAGQFKLPDMDQAIPRLNEIVPTENA